MVIVFKKKWSIFVVCAVALLATVGISLQSVAVPTSASPTANWGLSFQKNGQPPIGNADATYLKQYNAYYIGNTTSDGSESNKVLYLTFDAGFENGNTASILDTLKKHKVPACFFLVKNYLDTAPELVKRMVDEGHTVGNHTASHPDMSKIADKAAFQKELDDLEKAYQTVVGKPMEKLYRPPQGKFSEQNLKMAAEMGYTTYFWSLAYVDWYVDRQPSRKQAFDKLLPRTHPGAIVLLHSTSKTNAEILDELLTKWKGMGYRFGELQDISL
ncbi:MAG: polysaccharide deacetylase family protein [Clostridia bacterium]|jgi:peptidoglycan-N-acetylmuramic acid deacetylase|nr:polysaccharide deacetylase family protein [Clostridia bacterium]